HLFSQSVLRFIKCCSFHIIPFLPEEFGYCPMDTFRIDFRHFRVQLFMPIFVPYSYIHIESSSCSCSPSYLLTLNLPFYSFTEPDVSPDTIRFWKNSTKITIGIVTITVAAEISPHGIEYWL